MKQWWKNSVIYEIFPRSFKDSNQDGIGDIRGIISKVDYLEQLGVDALWICPVFSSPNVDSGYDVMNYYSICDQLGSMADFEELVQELHKRDMKIVLDIVLNHTSNQHPWFIESKKNKKNEYRDYYIWQKGENGQEPNNWLSSKMGGSVWEYDNFTDEYYLHLYAKEQPDLNWENEFVRQEVYKVLDYWIEKGVDGFRFDVINKIAKEPGLPDVQSDNKNSYQPAEHFYQNLPKVNEYLIEMNDQVFSNWDQHSILKLGQTSGVSHEQAQKLVYDNNQLDLILQFDHMDMNRDNRFRRKKFDFLKFKYSLARWQKAMDEVGWNTLFFGSHDSPRLVSNFGDDQTHHECSAKMLATVQLFLKGTPIIYQGDEIGMTNAPFTKIEQYQDERTLMIYNERVNEGNENPINVLQDLKSFSRDHARTPMQWNDNLHAGFSNVQPWMEVNPNYKSINVEKNVMDSSSILSYYKKLIRLRKDNEIILEGKFIHLHEEHPAIFSYMINNFSESLVVIANFSDRPETIDMEGLIKSDDYHAEYIIGNYEERELRDELITCLPYEAMVFQLKRE